MKRYEDQQEDLRAYIYANLDKHLDEQGEINLTALEEDVQDHFNMSDDDFENAEISLLCYDVARRAGRVK